MTPHKVEIGERYSDDSGWERRLLIDLQSGTLEIEIQGDKFSAHPRELRWIQDAINSAKQSIGLD